MSMNDYVNITMFRKFSFSYHNCTIDSDTMKSEKLVKLFAYLLSHYQRTVPSNELIEMLWYLDDVDNPIGALKNLIYRLRALLKKEFGFTDFIITGKGSYAINLAYHLRIDTVEFEKYEKYLRDSSKPEYFEKFLNEYTGKYLVEIKEDHNTLSKRVYYHSLYMDKVVEYAKLLEDKQDYEKMEIIAKRAIEIDNLEESIYEIWIRSLYFQQQYKKAKEIYKATTDLLYQTLGVKPSESMLKLYEMIKKESHDEDLDIMEIQQELSRDEAYGAFLCEYGTFREIYTMQSRMMGRLGICSQLCLVTILDHSQIEDQHCQKAIERMMTKVQDALLSGLRIGDVVSRLNVNQFVVLLPACHNDDAKGVMSRVLRKIKYSLNHTTLTIDFMVGEIMPKQ